MKQIVLAFTLITITLNYSIAQCIGDRYAELTFANFTKTSNVKYGENLNEGGQSQDLTMDIYEPEGDTATDRPVVILAHGGSFYGGTKGDGDVVAVCKDLAKRGYVTASINYRLTTIASLSNPDNMVKAVMRAVQDGKAAVRFFRNDADNSNTYKVDPTAIFFGGSSAGGVLSFQLAYMNDTSALTPKWKGFVEDLGGLEGASGNPGYSSEVTAVFGYAGAIADTNWIKEDIIPFMSMHAEDDITVPYNGGFPLGVPTLPTLYGSNAMNKRAVNVGALNEYYSYTGGAHPPHAAGQVVFDSTKSYTAQFIYDLIPCKTVSIYENDRTANISFYPNPTSNQITIENKELKPVNVSLYNVLGQKALKVNNVNATVSIDLSSLNKGIYFINFEDVKTNNLLSTSKVIIK